MLIWYNTAVIQYVLARHAETWWTLLLYHKSPHSKHRIFYTACYKFLSPIVLVCIYFKIIYKSYKAVPVGGHGHSVTTCIRSTAKCKRLIGNWSRNLLPCSTVPQQITLPCATKNHRTKTYKLIYIIVVHNNECYLKHGNKFHYIIWVIMSEISPAMPIKQS